MYAIANNKLLCSGHAGVKRSRPLHFYLICLCFFCHFSFFYLVDVEFTSRGTGAGNAFLSIFYTHSHSHPKLGSEVISRRPSDAHMAQCG